MVQGDVKTGVAEDHGTLGINAAVQQAGAGVNRARFAPQRHRRGQTIEADIHNRAVGEGRVKGVRVLTVEIALIAGGVLAVVEKRFVQFACLTERLLQQQKIWQAGGFEGFEQHHLVFVSDPNGVFDFPQV